MIIVKIELHSAITGAVTELGRTYICNRGDQPDPKRGNYEAFVCRKGEFDAGAAFAGGALRRGEVLDYPRLSYNVWRLVIRALKACFPEEAKP